MHPHDPFAPLQDGSVDAAVDEGRFVGIDPAVLSAADGYRLLLHCVAPRPIALTSTLSPDGAPNLAPFSYFMAGGANPPSVAISPLTDRSGRPKDTLRNIEATGEYVINVVTHALREPMNRASAEFPYGVDEWREAGLTPVPSVRVKPPRVLESPLAMECRRFRIVPHGDGPLAANYVIGEVVYFHVARSLIPDPEPGTAAAAAVDARGADYIARMGGDWYARADAAALFEMPRPPRVEKYPPAGPSGGA
jgi:flavin reductase (DIM6/NTAB) family NADH-FMN oxidoreductase RutF